MHQMEKDTFKSRFRDLYDSSGCKSITEFANMLKMNRQSVDRYYNGERCPDSPALTQICEKMKISADWLLGLSDISSISTDIKNACEVTGLSEEAIVKLQTVETGNKKAVSYSLSALIEYSLFENLMIEIDHFFDTIANLTIDDLQEYEPYTGADGRVELGRNAAAMFFRNNIVSMINKMCSDAYDVITQNLCDDSFVAYVNGDGRKVFFDKEFLKKLKSKNSTE